MSFEITEAFVQQYASNIYVLAQQKGSILRPYTRKETVQGKAKAFDRIGSKTASVRTTRHADTPQTDTPHSKRWVYMVDYHDGDLLDDMDKIRLLNDPSSEYMMAIVWALGRAADDEIIAASDATVVTDEDQGGTASLGDGQYEVAIDGSGGSANMNVELLRRIKRNFGANEIKGVQLHIAITSSQLYALLGQTEVTSSDYNAVKALVQGEVDTFMGFKFHEIERLDTVAAGEITDADLADGSVGDGASDAVGFRKIIAWAQDGLISAVGSEIKGRISERDDKCYSVQTYGSMSFGAVRMEEEKVVIGLCDESA